MQLPQRTANTGWWAEPGEMKPNETYKKEMDALEAYMAEAKAYYEASTKTYNV